MRRKNGYTQGQMKVIQPTLRSIAVAACISAISFFISCVQLNETAKGEVSSYKLRLEQLKRELSNNASVMDQSFDYSPGVVKKTETTDVELDKESGMLYVRNEIVVALKSGKSDDDFAGDAKSSNIECVIVGYVPTFNIIQVKLDPYSDEILEQIRQLDSVEQAQRSFVVQAQANETTVQYGWPIANYDIQLLWEKTKGKGVTIAVLDTGLDMSLSQFAGRIINPYSVVTGSSRFEDTVYLKNKDLIHVIDHGTKVAGIACAFDPINKLACGIAPEASIMPIQVFGYSLYKEKIIANDLEVIEGIARAIAFKADIINLSIGTDYSHIIPVKGLNSLRGDELNNLYSKLKMESSRIVSVYEKAFEACEKHDVVVVCSSGNEGIPAEYQPIPSHWYPITAGSINRQSKISGFSNNGWRVDCYAPGEDVFAVSPGGKAFAVSGTSFSAPYVSGILALAKSYGISKSRGEISEALKGTNIEGRLSILDMKSNNIFYPIGFFNFLGGRIEEKNTQCVAMARFEKKYGRCFIQKNDSDEIKLDKILSYYSIAGKINVKNDPEARFAISLLPKKCDYLLDRTSRITMPNFYAALILAGTKLSQSQLETACRLLPKSDYMSIILKANKYKGAIPGYYKRLTETPDQFNTNTLYALCEMEEYSSVDTIKSFLKRRQQDPIPDGDEDVACYALSWLCSSGDEESAALILATFERYKINYENNVQFRYSSWRNMAEALVRVGYPSGFAIALKAIERMDDSMAKISQEANQEGDSTSEETSTDFEHYYKEFQHTLNSYTDFGFKFDFNAKGERRRMLLESFYSAIQSCIWTGKIYTLD
jgi:subtilisin family serine protease